MYLKQKFTTTLLKNNWTIIVLLNNTSPGDFELNLIISHEIGRIKKVVTPAQTYLFANAI